jgi:hypothetical protein
MKKLSFVFALILSISIIQSCQKDPVFDPYEGQEAPQLPPAESFVINLLPFTQLDSLTSNEIDSRSVNNWGHSVANVLVWNTLLMVNMAVPTLAFYESFHHQAVYQGGGVWLWAYEVTDATGTYQAKLYGELLATDEVKWDMYISKVGGFTQVLWYSGIVANDQSYANWTLNYNASNPTPFVSIDFLRNNGNDVASIRFTNIIPGNPENGGYIEYRTGNVVPGEFDRAYDVYGAGIDNLLQINWDSVNKNGRVKDPNKFLDEEWHCWDTNLQDIDC